MKMTTVLTALMMAAGLLYPAPAPAQELPCPLPNITPAIADLAILLLDTNHDGQIYQSEIQRVYPDLDPLIFMVADSNFNGRLSRTEIINAVALAGVDPLSFIDTNGDGLIQYEEVSSYLTPEMFARFDINGNGVIDCVDYGYFMVKPSYGENEGDCGSADMLEFGVLAAMLYLDANNDGVIVFAEVEPLVGAEYGELLIDVLDVNDNYQVSPDEILTFMLKLPFDPMRIVDLDQDGAIGPADVEEFLDPALLSIFDYNEDGFLDCDDLALLPIDEDWGLIPVTNDEMVSLPLLELLQRAFLLLDENGDSALSYAEIRARMALPERIFNALDANRDGYLTFDEIAAWIPRITELSPNRIITLTREILSSAGGNFFIPGQAVLIRLMANKFGADDLVGFSITEMLPEGWTVGTVYNKGAAEIRVEDTDGFSKLVLDWNTTLPAFPLEITYELIPPATASGVATLLGQALFELASGSIHSGGLMPLALAELLPPEIGHSADINSDWRISLTELLRVIQLYNSGAYHVDPESEDGFGPGEGSTDGPYHTADYIADWRISLQELLRVIQLYNAPALHYYISSDTEDGFMPAPF